MGRSGKQSSKGLERAEVVGAAVALVTLAAALSATQQHPADDITLNAMGVSTITVKGSTTGTFFAYAKSMLLTASSGQLDVALPVPATDCSLIQPACHGGRAQVDQPVSSAWPAPRSLEVDNASGSQIHLGTIRPEQGGLGDAIELQVSQGSTASEVGVSVPLIPCGIGGGYGAVNIPTDTHVIGTKKLW